MVSYLKPFKVTYLRNIVKVNTDYNLLIELNKKSFAVITLTVVIL